MATHGDENRFREHSKKYTLDQSYTRIIEFGKYAGVDYVVIERCGMRGIVLDGDIFAGFLATLADVSLLYDIQMQRPEAVIAELFSSAKIIYA